MNYSQLYFKQLEKLDEMAGQAKVFSNPKVSENTRNVVLDNYERKAEKLGQKYGLKKTLIEEKGILKNYKYEFADGSSYVNEWF